MNEKIFSQLLDATRGFALIAPQSTSLVLQLLCWWKLSKESTALPEELRIAHLVDRDLTAQHEALRQVQAYAQFPFMDESVWQNLRGARDIAPLLQKIGAFEAQGFLDKLILDDAAFWSLDRRDGSFAFSPSLGELLIGLAGIRATQRVYVPWDNSGQLAARVVRSGATALVETRHPTLPAQILGVVSTSGWDINDTDPVGVPAALDQGRLVRFETSVCIPPMGLRYSSEVFENDLFDRFVEKTPVGSGWQLVTDDTNATNTAPIPANSENRVFQITNTPITYTLPETGGIGTLPYTLGGLLLMAAAALLLGQEIKRRREGC